MICQKEHRYYEEFASLPYAQDNQNQGRHVCAGCAYEQGVRDGLDNNIKRTRFDDLESSQAGNVRHRDPLASYDLGYSLGKRISS